MRILQLATQIPYPPTDGGKLSVFGITKYLSKRAHEIEFVSYCNKYPDDEVINGLKEYCNPHFVVADTRNNILKAAINLFSEIPYNASKYKTNQLKFFLDGFLKEEEFDIIHIDHLFLGWTVDIIRSNSDAPIVLRSQNLEMDIMKRFTAAQKNIIIKKFAELQYHKFKKFEPQTCSKFNMCIMISDEDKNSLHSINPSLNVKAIPAGIDEDLLSFKKKEVIPYSLVHIGHTDWYPNYDGLFWFCKNVMINIIQTFPQLKLFIYGGGNTYKFPIPDKLKNNVINKGFVDDLWSELQDKALAIVPLRIGGGIRIKILELLATGTNIITTSIGKEGIDITDGKEIIVADDTQMFKEKIIQYFQGSFDNEVIATRGKEFIINNYLWNNIAAKFESEYTKLIRDS
ncbi:MAG: glycosyltransferase family 4 protein [Ignavibacteria bacterium]|nr:glycosyltransferase family 4 protein [Ignavibacteria bacterium]